MRGVVHPRGPEFFSKLLHMYPVDKKNIPTGVIWTMRMQHTHLCLWDKAATRQQLGHLTPVFLSHLSNSSHHFQHLLFFLAYYLFTSLFWLCLCYTAIERGSLCGAAMSDCERDSVRPCAWPLKSSANGMCHVCYVNHTSLFSKLIGNVIATLDGGDY